MVNYVYGLIYTVIYVILCRAFAGCFIPNTRKLTTKCKMIYDIIWILTGAIVSIIWNQYIMIKIGIMIFTGAVFICLFYIEKWWKSVILMVFYHAICIAMDEIVLYIYKNGNEVKELSEIANTVTELLLGTLSQFLIFLVIVYLYRRFQNADINMLTETQWMRFLLFPTYTILMICGIVINFNGKLGKYQINTLLCIAVGMVIMNLFVFYLIRDIVKRESKIRQDAVLVEKAENEAKLYQQMTRSFDRQRKREHEFKNQITILAMLAKEKEYTRLMDNLQQYIKNADSSINVIETNHPVVNAIVNAKYTQAKEAGIAFLMRIGDVSECPLNDADLITILGNLLDNAIEACEKCPKGTAVIRFKMLREEEQLVLAVINTWTGDAQKEGEEYKTTKEDTVSHGLGLQNVKAAVEKNGGICVIKPTAQRFRVTISIPWEEREKNW